MIMTQFRLDTAYIFGYIMWSNFVVNGIFPFVVLVFLNIYIFKSIKNIQVSPTERVDVPNDKLHAGYRQKPEQLHPAPGGPEVEGVEVGTS